MTASEIKEQAETAWIEKTDGKKVIYFKGYQDRNSYVFAVEDEKGLRIDYLPTSYVHMVEGILCIGTPLKMAA